MPVSREVRVILVDDERPARERLRMLLAAEPDVTVVAECGDGDEALEAIRALRPDAVFLDVRMRRLSGMEVASRITPDHPIVIVFVTAHDEFAVEAFSANAADYLLKPITQAHASRAVARIRTRLASFTTQDLLDLRRIVDTLARQSAAALGTPEREGFGEVEVDRRARVVRRNGAPVNVSPRELDLLIVLLDHAGQVVSRSDLLTKVWGYQGDVYSRTVDMHVMELRRKLEVDPARPRHIVTVRKAGYRLDGVKSH